MFDDSREEEKEWRIENLSVIIAGCGGAHL
jgi:hypothetical protein